MPLTVTAAFSEFMKDKIRLDPAITSRARSSRDWLIQQIETFPTRHADFPALYKEIHIDYGSFARSTKIRELDDIDSIVGLRGLGTTYTEHGKEVRLTVPDGIGLRRLCHEGSDLLNSRRVINKFIAHLSEVPQYEKADVTRNGSAAVLKLTSHTWSFDIVPGFITETDAFSRSYYVIPDGNGHWMKTDPRIDQQRVSMTNRRHDGNVLDALRLVKYWNRRPTMPTVPSYLLECIVIGYYESELTEATAYVDIEIGPVLSHLAAAILSSVPDPKGIQGDLNTLAWQERIAIAARATGDAARAVVARKAETDGDHRTSIRLWGEILGAEFPTYG